MPGVEAVFAVPSGVAVVADDFWSAKKGRDALTVDWEGPNAALESAKLLEEYLALSKTPGRAAKAEGDAAAALGSAAKKLDARRRRALPRPRAHGAAELHRRSTAAAARSGRARSSRPWTSAPRRRSSASSPKKVVIHTTFLGGGFGRRANPASDFVAEAVQVAKAFEQPVKVVWTREDDIRGGYYRPMASTGSRAPGRERKPVAWRQRIVAASILAGTPFEAGWSRTASTRRRWRARPTRPSLAIPNHLVELHTPKKTVPVLWWRSVGHSHTAFAIGGFLDELAHAAGKDPLAFRLALLAKAPRPMRALKLAAEKAGWGKPLPRATAAASPSTSRSRAIVAQVAEVSVEKGRIRVPRVVCASTAARP